jgi:PRTRC genetic system ThiF family protein
LAKIKHAIRPDLLKRVVKVAVIGAGGTGSALVVRLVQLHHAMLALGHPGGLMVEVFDDDTVSEANIGRQCFYPCDVGQNKAMLLINRINMAWPTGWKAMPVRVKVGDTLTADIVIGCVDTRAARAVIMKCIKTEHTYYVDSGNSQNTGQVVLGELGDAATMQRHDRLPTIADLYPELVDPTKDAADNTPSCSVADALRKQSLVINNTMANEIFNLLWMLFRNGTLPYSGRFVNLESGISSPIKTDTDAWARMGYKAPLPV